VSALELRAKFNANVGLAGLESAAADELAGAIVNIDRAPDVAPLLARLAEFSGPEQPS
jgi:hypothetical protein